MIELKPCPFCGYEKPEPALSGDATCAVFCAGCGTLGPDPCETRDPADMWNRRAPDRAALVEVARRGIGYMAGAHQDPASVAERIVTEYLAEQAGKEAE